MSLSVEARRAAIAARHPNWVETNLDSYLRFAASDFGPRDLIVTDIETLSYDACVAETDRIAAALEAIGLQPGDRVAIIMPNLPIVVSLLFALWRLGLVAVPINTFYRTNELAYVLHHARCRFLVTVSDFNGQDFLGSLDSIAPEWRFLHNSWFRDSWVFYFQRVELRLHQRYKPRVPIPADQETF